MLRYLHLATSTTASASTEKHFSRTDTLLATEWLGQNKTKCPHHPSQKSATLNTQTEWMDWMTIWSDGTLWRRRFCISVLTRVSLFYLFHQSCIHFPCVWQLLEDSHTESRAWTAVYQSLHAWPNPYSKSLEQRASTRFCLQVKAYCHLQPFAWFISLLKALPSSCSFWLELVLHFGLVLPEGDYSTLH